MNNKWSPDSWRSKKAKHIPKYADATELKNSLKGTDTEEVKKKTQALVQSSMKLGEAIYKSQQKNTSTKGAEQNKNTKSKEQNKENVVDADFEEVKDDKDDKDKEKRA